MDRTLAKRGKYSEFDIYQSEPQHLLQSLGIVYLQCLEMSPNNSETIEVAINGTSFEAINWHLITKLK